MSDFKVAQGGLFHYAKVKYSRETETLIRELIKESKLSIFQRKELEKSVKNGDPLPLPPKKTAHKARKKSVPSLEELNVRYCLPRRRKLTTIQQLGAYEREKCVPSFAKANYEVEKKRLQEVMAFGRTLKSGKQRKKALNDDNISEYDYKDKQSKLAMIKEISEEIAGNRKFLEHMVSLNKGKKYREVTSQQIDEKSGQIQTAEEMFDKISIKD